MVGQGAESNVSQILSDEVNVVDENISIEKQSDIETDEKYIDMPSGEALSLKDTYPIMAKERTKLIVVIGPSESGKTTLETTLYQLFQSGQLGNFYFAGSKTLQGYEDRAFLTRINSGRSKPDTPRTSTGIQEQFLHLKVYNVEDGNYCNFLFADIAGEDYSNCIANSDEMKKQFPYFKNADFFVSLIDGKQVTDRAKRFSIPENLKQMFRTIVDAGLCKDGSVLQIVTSKYDIVDNDTENTKEIMEYLAQNETNLYKYFKNYFSLVEFVNIAAMPEVEGKYKCGFGIDKLLKTWCKTNKFSHKIKSSISVNLTAEFNKLSYKILEN